MQALAPTMSTPHVFTLISNLGKLELNGYPLLIFIWNEFRCKKSVTTAVVVVAVAAAAVVAIAPNSNDSIGSR